MSGRWSEIDYAYVSPSGIFLPFFQIRKWINKHSLLKARNEKYVSEFTLENPDDIYGDKFVMK